MIDAKLHAREIKASTARIEVALASHVQDHQNAHGAGDKWVTITRLGALAALILALGAIFRPLVTSEAAARPTAVLGPVSR